MTAPKPTVITFRRADMSRNSPNKPTKSYLNRPDPVRQESQARRRSLIKNSLQVFLVGDSKENIPRDENKSKERRSTHRRERRQNCISSMFLSPRQKQRAKAQKEKKRQRHVDKNCSSEKKNRKVLTPETIERAQLPRVEVKEKLSDSQETMMTTTLGNSSFDSAQDEMPSLESKTKDCCKKLRSPLRTKKKDAFMLSLSPRKLLSPRRSPRKVVLSKCGDATVHACDHALAIHQLPFADETPESIRATNTEDSFCDSTAIDYVDGADWGHLEWNAILPSNDYHASIRSSRSEIPRKRGSLTHKRKIPRRASCSGNPSSERRGI